MADTATAPPPTAVEVDSALPEHAKQFVLLAGLLHTPGNALVAGPQLDAPGVFTVYGGVEIYRSITGLAEAGELADAEKGVGERQQKQRMQDNYAALVRALAEARFIDSPIQNPEHLVRQMHTMLPSGMKLPRLDPAEAVPVPKLNPSATTASGPHPGGVSAATASAAPGEFFRPTSRVEPAPGPGRTADPPPAAPNDNGTNPPDPAKHTSTTASPPSDLTVPPVAARPPRADGVDAARSTARIRVSSYYTARRVEAPEHALIGSIVNAPAVITQLERFLSPRDFSTPELRGLYATVRGLAHAGALVDPMSADGDRSRQQAISSQNYRCVVTALQNKQFTKTAIAHAPALLAQVFRAAPAETRSYKGVYNRRSQLWLGRRVLEQSVKRRVEGLGMQLRRSSPLARPSLLRRLTRRHSEQDVQTRLAMVDASVERISERLALAVRATGPSPVEPVVPAIGEQAAHAAEPHRNWRQRLAAPLVQRAELHLIQLALHSGTESLPDLSPRDFSVPAHANTWSVIQDLHAQGRPADWTAVFEASEHPGCPLPLLSDHQLSTALNSAPPTEPRRIARSLRTVVNNSLRTCAEKAASRVQTAAQNKQVDAQELLGFLSSEATTLRARVGAKTPAEQHKTATDPHPNPTGATR